MLGLETAECPPDASLCPPAASPPCTSDPAAPNLAPMQIDIEQDPEVAEAADVTGTPTIQLFKNKDMLLIQPGVKQKREYRELISANM